MSEDPAASPASPGEESDIRCPNCDSVISADDVRCLMCGAELERSPEPGEPSGDDSQVAEDSAEEAIEPDSGDPVEPVAQVDSTANAPTERPRSRLTPWMTAIFVIFMIVLGALILRFQGPVVGLAFVPSLTPVPNTPTYTPTWTPLPTSHLLASDTPLPTFTIAPTHTLQPPRQHRVNSGETLTDLGIRYSVSIESIAAASGVDPGSPIAVGQLLLIPWPTATPPLVSVAVTVNGVQVVADPADCERYAVASGDTLTSISLRFDIDLELLLLVNRLEIDSILRQGDSICVPKVIYGGVLPPTPGPSPTSTPTSVPVGPQLLYPVDGAVIGPDAHIVTLQWAAVKDLATDEWYMVEMTNEDELDALPLRDFTRDTSLQLSNSWRPPSGTSHRFRWRVSIVRVTGERSDGVKTYTYGGQSSAGANFTWSGIAARP